MAAFVAFELWIPLLALVLRALVGPTVPTAMQAVVPLFGLAVPVIVGLALSDYLADRRGLVRPYQPKRRPGDLDGDTEPHEDEGEEEDRGDEEEGPAAHHWEEDGEEPAARQDVERRATGPAGGAV